MKTRNIFICIALLGISFTACKKETGPTDEEVIQTTLKVDNIWKYYENGQEVGSVSFKNGGSTTFDGAASGITWTANLNNVSEVTSVVFHPATGGDPAKLDGYINAIGGESITFELYKENNEYNIRPLIQQTPRVFTIKPQ